MCIYAHVPSRFTPCLFGSRYLVFIMRVRQRTWVSQQARISFLDNWKIKAGPIVDAKSRYAIVWLLIITKVPKKKARSQTLCKDIPLTASEKWKVEIFSTEAKLVVNKLCHLPDTKLEVPIKDSTWDLSGTYILPKTKEKLSNFSNTSSFGRCVTHSSSPHQLRSPLKSKTSSCQTWSPSLEVWRTC